MKAIDASLFKKCFLAGAGALESRKEYINERNVFPVPDGDTGTNMTMTIMAAAKEVEKLKNPTIEEIGKAISSGSLRGARGNSGVILSQIFRGFSKELKGLDTLEVTDLGNGIQHAAQTAYKAVMKPKEGTILTVAKAGAERSVELLMADSTEDILEFANAVAEHMEEILAQTPDMLPVLKQAGVVDSGGEGLMTFIRGCLDALAGKEIRYQINMEKSGSSATLSAGVSNEVDTADIRFGYCTEFIIMLEGTHEQVENDLKEYLQSLGDCVVVVADDEIVKVHVHTNDPGLAIQKALTYGSLTSIKIDNMREEHNEKVIRDAQKLSEQEQQEEKQPEHKEIGFLAVSAGDGLRDIFIDLGVDYVIEGGQTMNPSTEDILEAIHKVDADTIYVLPNNGNIILAAQQAAKLEDSKQIVVLPSKNIPQGIVAMINYMEGKTTEENVRQMTEEMNAIHAGQVTYAVRDTVMDGKEIHQGDYMGLTDKKILSVGTVLEDTALELVQEMMEEKSELVSLYYGEGIGEEDAEKLADRIMAEYPEVEVEIQYGGQPVYAYFISVE